MKSDRGIALILALLFLSFLTILGGALLATSTIDVWISDNYKTATQLLYLTEAGIDHAMENLRAFNGALAPNEETPFVSSMTDIGRYDVWLRTDTAGRLTLVSVGKIRTARKTIEVTVKKGEFPLDPPASIAGLERLVTSIAANATDVYNPTAGTPQTFNNFGNPANYRVAVVNGDAELGGGSGYGMLVVRGDLRITGSFNWTGLIAVIGTGVLEWNESIPGLVTGGIFRARTRAEDGTLLSVPADVVVDFNDTAAIAAANRSFPYTAISIKEK